MVIVGSGAIGIEFASFYNDMGAKVTVLEMQEQILPVEDADIATAQDETIREARHNYYDRRFCFQCQRQVRRAYL